MDERSPTNRIFFIHVMKTAGTSLVSYIRDAIPPEHVYPCRGIDFDDPGDTRAYMNVPRLLAVPEARRQEVQVYTGHFPFMAHTLLQPDLATITVLREPVDRVISILKQFKRTDPRFRDASLTQVYEDQGVFRWYVSNHQTRVFALRPDDGAESILFPLTIDDSRLDIACDNLNRCDIVGLTESFDEFIADVNSRFGWWPSGLPTERLNVSRTTVPVEESLRARIASDNAFDVAFYQRAIELVSRRRRAANTD